MKYLDTKQGSVEEAISQAMGGVVAKDLLEAGGKYLKYSDLLLQKGRLMAKGANTAMIDKQISKEMKKLGIKESKDEYEKFFNSALKKFGVDSPADFKDDAKKKEFFNYVDKNYKGKSEELDKEDTPTVKKVVGMLKKASKAHAGQAKQLSKDLKDETLNEGKMKELASYIAKGMSAKQIAKKMNVDVKAIEALMKEQARNDIKEYIQSDGTRRKVKEGDKRRTENKLNEDEVVQEGALEIEFDPTDFKQNRGPISNKDVTDTVKSLQKEFPGIKGKKTGKYTIKFDHMGTSDYAKAGGFSVNKLALALDGMGFDLSDKERRTKLRGIRGEYEPDNVDETLDKIREANIAKQKSMREILADIWNMNEGKNPFDLGEAASLFISTPDRSEVGMKDSKKFTAAIKKHKLKSKFVQTASKNGHEVTGRNINDITKFITDFFGKDDLGDRFVKKGNKYVDMYDEGFEGKTATGEKPTKVEIEPEVK